MKTIMLFVHPDKDFLPEHKIMIKIQIDNMLSLGWNPADIILATNFFYEYRGVKSILVSDDNYCDFCHTFTLVNVILELFERKIIKDGELYWYHDEDAYQLLPITESELDLGNADMGMCYKGIKEKWDFGCIFFKSSAYDIFCSLKEVAYKYKVNEEYDLMGLYTNNLLWITDTESEARMRFVPLYIPAKKMAGRIKTLNLRYMFSADCINAYDSAIKPLKVIHFTFTDDLYFDSAMYGKNSLKMPLMTERLIKIFQSYGIFGTHPKKLKNLMIYLNPEKVIPNEIEKLIKAQIDNSIKLGWERQNIILITNFPYEYGGVKAMEVGNSLPSANYKAVKASVIFWLLDKGVPREAEIWWYHDLDVFQSKPMNGDEIDLDGATAGFINFGQNKFNLQSFFFRKGANKLFEWMRNKTHGSNTNEEISLESLAKINYRNINTMYKRFNLNSI